MLALGELLALRAEQLEAGDQLDARLGGVDDVVDEPTLGGLATSLDCVDPTGFVSYPFGNEALIGFQFTCKVIRADS